jgi:hypothetical protein
MPPKPPLASAGYSDKEIAGIADDMSKGIDDVKKMFLIISEAGRP